MAIKKHFKFQKGGASWTAARQTTRPLIVPFDFSFVGVLFVREGGGRGGGERVNTSLFDDG